MSKKKAIVILSGGLDSTVNLYWAHEEMQIVAALTFAYGQRAARKEIYWAGYHCQKLGVRHLKVELPMFHDFTSTSLVARAVSVPTAQEVAIDDLNVSLKTAAKVWVPNRNGVFLNIAAAYAEGWGAQYVIPGFNREEAATFPDNTQAFMQALDHSFSYSTQNQVKVFCFTVTMDKVEIGTKARSFGLSPELVWSCYLDQESPCGSCESCQRSRRAWGE